MDTKTINTNSDAATMALGRRLAKLLKPGMVLALYGGLGAGKTVLSRGIARGLGITELVTSPTFTVVQEYRRPDQTWFFHLDMYRITNEEAALAFGIEDYLFADDGITVIEWPERIEGLLEAPSDSAAVADEASAAGNSVLPRLLQFELKHAGREQRQIRMPAVLGDVLGNESLQN